MDTAYQPEKYPHSSNHIKIILSYDRIDDSGHYKTTSLLIIVVNDEFFYKDHVEAMVKRQLKTS